MAETLAIVGLVSAIVQFVDFSVKTLNRLKQFRSKGQDIPEAFREISNQLPLLLADLQHTKLEVEAGRLDQALLDPVLAVINGCQAQVEELDGILVKALPNEADSSWRAGRKTISSFHHGEKIRRIADKLRDNIICLTHHSVITSQPKRLGGLILNIHDAEQLRLLEWLSSFDPSAIHNRACEARVSDTSEWFLDSEYYIQWRMAPSSFVWLHGKPGCGKTVLCSSIIEAIQDSFSPCDTLAVLAYFYFDFNDTSTMSVANLLRSIIRQICTAEASVPTIVQTICSRYRASGLQPSIKILLSTLSTIIVESRKEVFIILDALDEYPRERRHELLATLKKLVENQPSCLHVLITSRKEVDIKLTFRKIATEIPIQDSSIDDDIKKYVEKRVAEDPRLSSLPNRLKEDITIKVGKGANGMFRWALCQIDVLCTSRPSAIGKALHELPTNLDGTYERILSNIPPSDCDEVISVLNWLAFSQRPLTVEEATEAALSRSDQGVVDPDDRHSLDVVHICRCLVSCHEERLVLCGEPRICRVVRFAHFSVKEYLLSDRIKCSAVAKFAVEFAVAHDQIAKCCLSTLLRNQEDPSQPSILDQLPLIRYAAEYWFKHVNSCGAGVDLRQPLVGLINELFGDSAVAFQNRLSVYNPYTSSKRRLYSGPYPLYFAAVLGLIQTVDFLLDRGADVNCPGGKYGNPLSAASARGDLNLVTLLLDRGADINRFGGLVFGRPLQAACFFGFEQTVRLLLTRGADVNARPHPSDTALQAACERGHYKLVEILIDAGANVNQQGGGWGTALQAASERGHELIVRLLLSRGAQADIQGGQFGSPLQAASSQGYKSIVRLLLDTGVNINAQGGGFRGALNAAAIRRHDHIVALLLDRGADINLILQGLLDKGAGTTSDDEVLARSVETAFAENDKLRFQLLRLAALRSAQLLPQRRTAIANALPKLRTLDLATLREMVQCIR